MSRDSQAKRARRRKRRAARDESWIPGPRFDQVLASAESDPVAEALADVDDWMAERGWVLDDEVADRLVSWFYPPSAAEFDGEDREPVTRIWITAGQDDETVVLEFGATLVGDGGDDDPYLLDPDSLEDDVAALEAYRPGSPRPELD